MSQAPAPLVPAEVDLRDFAFLPLEGRRLLTSETWILGTNEERCAALCLLIESWYQVPPASLPDNDKMLRYLSQAGARWPKVKAHALRGWVKASDGKLYHPVLAEKALDAWERKTVQRKRTAAARAARHKGAGAPATTPTSPTVTISVTETVTGSKGQGQGQGQGQSTTSNPLSGEQPPDDARAGKSGPKATSKPAQQAKANRQQARAAAERAIEYLNAKAGTKFRVVEANLKLPAARILQDGALEADLLAVVDLKVAESERGEFERKYLRPLTLWNAEKFAQYSGQVNAQPPGAKGNGPPAPTKAEAYFELQDGKLVAMAEYPIGPHLEVARTCARDYATRIARGTVRNIMIRIGPEQRRFTVQELEQ